MARTNELIDVEKLKDILLKGEYLGPDEIAAATALEQKTEIPFPEAVVSLGFLTKDIIGQAIAEFYGRSYADMDSMPADRELILKIPEPIARKYHVVCVSEKDNVVVVATEDPNLLELTKELEVIFGTRKVEIRYTLPENIDTMLRLYDKPLAVQFAELFSSTANSVPDIVRSVLDHAVDLKVSDVHFEPRRESVMVRFRIDGHLIEVAQIPLSFYQNILNRIKVLARLPFDEHQRAQDGSFQHESADTQVNIRVSVAPTIEGEKVVLRLLASAMTANSLETLGCSLEHSARFKEAAMKPFGMVLVTGPTGSGKTTSLYAFLNILNTPEVNITTIEDPVEYKVAGVNQMQVNPATEFTFARGLRSIVRQDPDIVLVGEIRDQETAEIAVNAALTGHLLFSTFHSNDAATTVPRLFDMGIEPFLLASTIELIVAQRLVRKICDVCRASYTLTRADLLANMPRVGPYFSKEKSITLYRGNGCNACHNTGYRGRTGIFEFIATSPAMQELIASRPTRTQIWDLARTQGSTSLFDDGLTKVRLGVTTLEELLRVAAPDASET